MRLTQIVAVAVLAVMLAVLAAPADAGAAKKRGRYYGGVTSEGAPFVLELARSGKAVARARIMARPDCADGSWSAIYGEMTFLSDLPESVRLGAHSVVGRKVSRTGKFTAAGLGSEDYGENIAAVAETISGRVRRNGIASGTLGFDVTIRPKAGGEPVATCSSELRWNARSRRGEVFGGQTDQGMPAVLELNAQRNRVAHLRFGWGASCAPAGSIFVPDHLMGFGVAGGAFDSTFEQPFPIDGGGTGTWSYTLDGRVSGRNASGDIAAKLTETDAAATVTMTCDVGSLTWSAHSG
jgi:hypothetical protein